MAFYSDGPQYYHALYYRDDFPPLPNVRALQTHGCDFAGRVRDHEDDRSRVRDQSDFVNNAPNHVVSPRQNSEDGKSSDPDYGSISHYDSDNVGIPREDLRRLQRENLGEHPNMHIDRISPLRQNSDDGNDSDSDYGFSSSYDSDNDGTHRNDLRRLYWKTLGFGHSSDRPRETQSCHQPLEPESEFYDRIEREHLGQDPNLHFRRLPALRQNRQPFKMWPK